MRSPRFVRLLSALVVLLVPPALGAQATWSSPDGAVVAHSSSMAWDDEAAGALPLAAAAPSADDKAAFIAIYDDGAVDVFYGFNNAIKTYELAMLFDGIGGPDVTLDAVEVCLRRTGSDQDIRFEIVIWDDDGPGGIPGTELASFPAQATGVGTGASFSTHPVGFPVADDVYVGIRLNPIVDEDFWFCVDRDGIDGTLQPAYRRVNESGSWTAVESAFADPSYRAVMFRGFLSTPGVVAEALLVPFFEVDKTSGTGLTTLFAVRNVSEDPVTATIDYRSRNGDLERTDTVSLDPNEVETVNLRNVTGLPVSGGFSTGYIEIITSGNPDGTPVLAGDFFLVDVGENFATGERTPRLFQDICDIVSTRFVDFGVATQIVAWISNPRGTDPADPPSLAMRFYDESGALQDSWTIQTNNHIVELDVASFTAERFGSVVFDFTNSGGGVVYGESSAGGRFSVGLGGECEER